MKREPKGKAKAEGKPKVVKAGGKKSPFNNTFVDFAPVKDLTVGELILKYNKSMKIPIPSISKTVWSLIKDNNLLNKK